MKSRAAKKIYKKIHFRDRLPPHLQRKEIHRYHLKALKTLDEYILEPWYIYDEKTGNPVCVTYSEYEWWGWNCGKRWVKRTEMEGDGLVSTVFDGVNSGIFYNKKGPTCFSTMLYKNNFWGEERRAETLNEALRDHEELIALYPNFRGDDADGQNL